LFIGWNLLSGEKMMAQHLDDLNLPNSAIEKLIQQQQIGVQFSEEATTAISRAATVFILFCTSKALEITLKDSRRVIKAEDVIYAARGCNLPNFTGPVLAKIHAATIVPDKRMMERAAAGRKRRHQVLDDESKLTINLDDEHF
ncbi:DNA polymerase epsilon subunit 3, partial [Trichinella pseudospiralis]